MRYLVHSPFGPVLTVSLLIAATPSTIEISPGDTLKDIGGEASSLLFQHGHEDAATLDHPLWLSCPMQARSNIAVHIDGESTSLAICPWQLPAAANLTWSSATTNMTSAVNSLQYYRAKTLRMATPPVLDFCRNRRISNLAACQRLVIMVSDLIGPLRALHPPADLESAKSTVVYQFVHPDPTVPHSTRTRCYVVFVRKEEPVAVRDTTASIVIDNQPVPALSTSSPETESMYFGPGSISEGRHLLGIEVDGILTDGVMISIKDPSIRMNALHIDGRFRNSVQIDLSVGHELIGDSRGDGYALRWPEEWNVCILCDGLQLCAVSGRRFAADFLGDSRRGFANLTVSIGGLTAGRHFLGALIVDGNRKVVAMNSEEVQAEFEFDDGESNSESNPVKPPSPFVRRGDIFRDISSKKLPMNLRQGCGYGSFEDIEKNPVCPPTWTFELSSHEWGYYSQNGEDGVLQAILHHVDPVWRDARDDLYFVEFGVEDGAECNTRMLREKYGWKGVMFDARSASNRAIGLHQSTVSPNNINHLFAVHGVPRHFAVMSVSDRTNEISF